MVFAIKNVHSHTLGRIQPVDANYHAQLDIMEIWTREYVQNVLKDAKLVILQDAIPAQLITHM